MNIKEKMALVKRLKELVYLLQGADLSAIKKLKFVKETKEIITKLGGQISNEDAPSPSFNDDLALFSQFVGPAQLEVVKTALQGEEKEAFVNIVQDIAKTIREMPKTYETDGQGLKAIAHLHYFIGSSDWYVSEKDMEAEQQQAFGLVSLDGDYPELGYINIEEITKAGAELDFYYTQQSFESINKKLAGGDDNSSENAFFDALLSGTYDYEANSIDGLTSLLERIEANCETVVSGGNEEEKAGSAIKYWANLADSLRQRVLE